MHACRPPWPKTHICMLYLTNMQKQIDLSNTKAVSTENKLYIRSTQHEDACSAAQQLGGGLHTALPEHRSSDKGSCARNILGSAAGSGGILVCQPWQLAAQSPVVCKAIIVSGHAFPCPHATLAVLFSKLETIRQSSLLYLFCEAHCEPRPTLVGAYAALHTTSLSALLPIGAGMGTQQSSMHSRYLVAKSCQ